MRIGMPLTLRQLRYFVTLSEAGGFGAAAERMHVSQPALSLQIKELEGELGVTLVERLPRGLRLTGPGREALARARRILTEVADLELAVQHTGGLTGQLALGIIPTVAPYLLPLALTRLKGLELRVREAQTSALIEGLERGQLDAVVIASPPGLGFEVLHLVDDRFLLAGSQARLKAWAQRAEALRPSELPGDQLLLLEEGHCLSDQALQVCQLSKRPAADLGASSLSTLVRLVAGGFGMTLLPEIAASTEARGGLALMRFAGPEPSRTLLLVVRQGLGAGEWVEQLGELLREALIELISQAAVLLRDPSGQ